MVKTTTKSKAETNLAPVEAKSHLVQTIEHIANRPEISGLKSGEATSNLLNHVGNAVFYGTAKTEELVEWKQRAAYDTMKAMRPTDAIEGQLIAQMVATNEAAMECFRRAALPEQTFEGRQASLGFANKLLRTYAVLVETLNKHRGKGQQTMRVEHVTVQAGGQAIVGHVATGGGGDGRQIEHQPHAQHLGDALQPALRGEDTEWVGMPRTGGPG
jgi:hypothetical protein